MKPFLELYDYLDFPGPIKKLVVGDISLPLYEVESPIQTSWLPPAVLPLWGDGPFQFGYLYHHKLVNRESYCHYDYNSTMMQEVARSAKQLYAYICQQAISDTGEVEPEVIRFAEQVGFDGLDEIVQLCERYGDDEAGLLEIDYFGTNPPAICFASSTRRKDKGVLAQDSVPRDFETESVPTLQTLSSLEGYPDVSEASLELKARLPAWFFPDKVQSTFDQMLESGCFKEAWLALNSNGWLFEEARTALARLAQASQLPSLLMLSKSWDATPHGKRLIQGY